MDVKAGEKADWIHSSSSWSNLENLLLRAHEQGIKIAVPRTEQDPDDLLLFIEGSFLGLGICLT
jgi:hypothetical protein